MVGLADDVYDPPVIAYLPPPLLSNLRAAVRDTVTLHVATGYEELDTLLSLHPRAVLVADPNAAPGLIHHNRMEVIFDRYPLVRGITYTAISPRGMHGFGLFARHGLHHCIVQGVDDNANRIRDLLLTVPGDMLAERLVARVEPMFRRLPVSLHRAVRMCIMDLNVNTSPAKLAVSGGVSRRGLDTILERTGLAPANTIIKVARMTRFYYYTAGRHIPARNIAPRLGWLTVHTLGRDTKSLTGLMPSQLAKFMSEDDFLDMMADVLFRRVDSRQKTQTLKRARRKRPVVTVAEISAVSVPADGAAHREALAATEQSAEAHAVESVEPAKL